MCSSDRREEGRPSNVTRRGGLQLEESRRSFHRQVEQLQDIDDKAMRSVRTAVVVIGFVVTTAGVASRLGSVSFGLGSAVFTAIGVSFLTATVVVGIGTATVTEYRTRLTAEERARLERPAGGYSRQTAELVRIYYSWLDAAEAELSESAALLGATFTTLSFGVVSLSIAAALAVVEATYLFEGLDPTYAILLNLVTVVSVLGTLGVTTKLTIRSVKKYL